MKVTSQPIKAHVLMGRHMSPEFTIPAGTALTSQTAMGFDHSYNFVSDLSWLTPDLEYLRHDLEYSGFNVDARHVCNRWSFESNKSFDFCI